MDEQKVREYFEKKDELQSLQDILTERREAFEESQSNLKQGIEIAKEELHEIKTNLTEEAEREFESTNNKKLYGGIGIRESESLEYEPTKALEWSKKHDACLVLDKRAFEKLAKTNQFTDMDFIVTHKKTTVTFPEKLKY